MKILSINDPAFKKYGRIVDNVDLTELYEGLKKTPCPEGTVYVAGDPELEALKVAEAVSRVIYGEMPVQIGYCNGHNSKLNALEYHRDSEINVAATDAILMLGLQKDVEADFTYDDEYTIFELLILLMLVTPYIVLSFSRPSAFFTDPKPPLCACSSSRYT